MPSDLVAVDADVSKTSTFYLAVPSLNVASKITFEATIGIALISQKT